jgi:ADP-heptose:LPS heptosyltransferase
MTIRDSGNSAVSSPGGHAGQLRRAAAAAKPLSFRNHATLFGRTFRRRVTCSRLPRKKAGEAVVPGAATERKPSSCGIRRLRRRPLGRYRYVRLRWRVTFAVIDLLGTLLFAAARVVRRLVARTNTTPPSLQPDPKVILLVQLDHLGDAIISTAMLPALREAYPRASIEVLAGAWNREVFEALPEVDRVHVSRANRFARSGLARLAWVPATFWWGLALRRRKVDLGIDVRGEFPVALVLWLCGARQRLGWACGGGGFLLTDHAEFVPGRPEVESRAALLAAVGIRPSNAAPPRPSFPPPAAARRLISRELAEFCGHRFTDECDGHRSVDRCHGHVARVQVAARARRPGHATCPSGLVRPLVVLHLGAGTPAKTWPVEHWQELLGRIIVAHGAQVILVGSREDRIIAGRVLAGQSAPSAAHEARPTEWAGVADWTGRLSIVELAALLRWADVFVGADSGPAHLAAAVGAPAVVLMSGTNSTRQWQPCGEQVSVLRREVGCSPCHRERCPRPGHPCMRLLLPWQVAAAVDQALSQNLGPRGRDQRDPSSASATPPTMPRMLPELHPVVARPHRGARP